MWWRRRQARGQRRWGVWGARSGRVARGGRWLGQGTEVTAFGIVIDILHINAVGSNHGTLGVDDQVCHIIFRVCDLGRGGVKNALIPKLQVVAHNGAVAEAFFRVVAVSAKGLIIPQVIMQRVGDILLANRHVARVLATEAFCRG